MGKRKIIWTDRASLKLHDILNYYSQRNKSKTYSITLFKKFKLKLKMLVLTPEVGIKTNFPNVRGLIVGHFILFYEYDPERIIVHYIWDSRQNPENLKIR